MVGSMISTAIAIGDELNLFHRLYECEKPVTSQQFADKTGLNERWIREWLLAMGGATLVDVYAPEGHTEGDDPKFSLPESSAVYLCAFKDSFGENSNVGFFRLVTTLARRLHPIVECFSTGGGLSYDGEDPHGDIAKGLRHGHAKTFLTVLVPELIPRFDRRMPEFKLIKKLESGIRVADVGCGCGDSTMAMAAAFPKSEFHCFELSTFALTEISKNIRSSGLSNVFVHDVAKDPMGAGAHVANFDFAFSYDLIHDCAHPGDVIAAVRKGLRPGAAWFVVDIQCQCSATQQMKNGYDLYLFSLLLCMPSGLNEKGGMGLGTAGLRPSVADKLFKDHGFSSVVPWLEPDVSNNQLFAVLV